MSQTKHEIQALLSAAGTEPRYRFGQNFMIDQNLVRLVAEAGGLTPDDVVIEVGPGTGTLTEELLARAGRRRSRWRSTAIWRGCSGSGLRTVRTSR